MPSVIKTEVAVILIVIAIGIGWALSKVINRKLGLGS